MVYFNFFYYLIITHVVLAVSYKLYIYYIYKSYQVEFNRRSAFFLLVRKEIIENIDAQKVSTESYLALKRLLLLHNILSITGKVILTVFGLIIIILMFGRSQ